MVYFIYRKENIMLNYIKSKIVEKGIFFCEDKNCITFLYTDFTLYIFEKSVVIYSPLTPDYPLRCDKQEKSIETIIEVFAKDYSSQIENKVAKCMGCTKFLDSFYIYKNIMFRMVGLKLEVETNIRHIEYHISGMHPSEIKDLMERENTIYEQSIQLYRKLTNSGYMVRLEKDTLRINQRYLYNLISHALSTNNEVVAVQSDHLLEYLKKIENTEKQGPNQSTEANVSIHLTNNDGKKEHYSLKAKTLLDAIYRVGLTDRTDITKCTITFQGRKKS